MSTADGIRQGIYSNPAVRRIARWLDAVPHPHVACEIAAHYVAAARWSRASAEVEAFAVEPLPPGALTPSAIETNVGSSRVDLQACKLEYSIVSPK